MNSLGSSVAAGNFQPKTQNDSINIHHLSLNHIIPSLPQSISEARNIIPHKLRYVVKHLF